MSPHASRNWYNPSMSNRNKQIEMITEALKSMLEELTDEELTDVEDLIVNFYGEDDEPINIFRMPMMPDIGLTGEDDSV